MANRVHADLPEVIQAARVRLIHKRPYLAAILYRLTPVAVEGMGTMAVDKYARLYFDPKAEWKREAYETVLYHEVCHLLRDHAGRGDAIGVTDNEHQDWNICGDAEINDDINAEDKEAVWPFEVVTPSQMGWPDNEMAEEYYTRRKKDRKKGGKGTPNVGNGKCGSVAGGPKQEYEEDAPPTAGGKKDAAPGLSDAEKEAVRHKVAADVREHQKSRGSVPGWLQEWAQQILEPKLDWRKVLRSTIRHTLADIAGQTDFTYQRPARRRLPKIVLPALRQPSPNIAIVVDTSGSVSNDDLAIALGEVNGVLKQCGQKQGVEAIVCDAAVHSAKRVFRADQIRLGGRGGTDMRVGVEEALNRQMRPHAIIIMTDGHTPWPAPISGVRLVACLIGKGRAKASTVPSHIRTVEVD